MGLHTINQRFEQLWPHIQIYGPDDDLPRPAFIMFHGCGGLSSNLIIYASIVARLGVRAYVVDSFAARRWSRKLGARLVCTGLRLRGLERSGDVLAALTGIAARPDVDADKIILAGWSHGAWGIMDLMTQKLTRSGEAKLADPSASALGGIKGLFLAYPYVNFLARSISRPWQYKPKTKAILSLNDHLASYSQSVKLINRLRQQGVEVDTISFNATHAFDEEGIDKTRIMHFDKDALDVMIAEIEAFVREQVVQT